MPACLLDFQGTAPRDIPASTGEISLFQKIWTHLWGSKIIQQRIGTEKETPDSPFNKAPTAQKLTGT
jgi:hypothetical protein